MLTRKQTRHLLCLNLLSVFVSNSIYLNAFAFKVSHSLSSFGITAESGHEEITRQAFELFVEDNLENKLTADGSPLLPELLNQVSKKALGFITLGNFATDIPRGPYPIKLIEFLKFPENVDYHNDYNVFNVHALRNFTDETKTGVESARSACLSTQALIVNASLMAAQYWTNKDYNKSYFMMGHALHTLQDSFSRAHVIRDRIKSNSNLLQICHYNGSREPSIVDLCFHLPLDDRDNIWITNEKQVKLAQSEWSDTNFASEKVLALEVANLENLGGFDINTIAPAERKNYLTHEARLAKYASARYLILMSRFLNQPSANVSDLKQTIQSQLFNGNTKANFDLNVMPNGVLRCDQL